MRKRKAKKSRTLGSVDCGCGVGGFSMPIAVLPALLLSGAAAYYFFVIRPDMKALRA